MLVLFQMAMLLKQHISDIIIRIFIKTFEKLIISVMETAFGTMNFKLKSSEEKDESKNDHLVEVAFNILQVAVIMRKNHILEILLKENSAGTDDFLDYIDKPSICCENIDRSWISAANTLHLAAKFNPEALYVILDKVANSDTEGERKSRKSFWEKTSEREMFWKEASRKDGFSPLHNAVTNMDALSTR